MEAEPKVLIVIPARGGSKGIPRKNMRPLNGKPLIWYSIRNALNSTFKPNVCVSSDDDEILQYAATLGVVALKRPDELGGDKVTLDPVVHHAVEFVEKEIGSRFDLIVTMQPTSPLLKSSSLDSAIRQALHEVEIDTVISAKEDTHLSWRFEEERFVPNYSARVNRQQLPAEYRETGGFFISRRRVVSEASRIGGYISLYLLDNAEAIDIDDYDHWALCEYHLRRKKVLFVVAGNRTIGLGHVYNALLLAHEILDHDIAFLVDNDSQLAKEKIQESNYTVIMQGNENLIEDIKHINPDVVVNDRLDTSADYIFALKELGCFVVNFEDLGPGAKHADLVINAIYPELELYPNHYFGHTYFALRDEFVRLPVKRVDERVRKVLVTFGGVDPNDYTSKVISEIFEYCRKHAIKVEVIAGFGYAGKIDLSSFNDLDFVSNVSNMAQHILDADIIFTSAGRTTYEVASIGTPAIVLAQNQREMTHFFARQEHGFINLGLGYCLDEGRILAEFERLVGDYQLRRHMNSLMLSADLRHSKQNVVNLVRNAIKECQ